MVPRARALILLAPFQRLQDHFVFIRAGEMPQEPFGASRINERRKRTTICTPPNVQLDHIMAVINASPKRLRVPHLPPKTRIKSESYELAVKEACHQTTFSGGRLCFNLLADVETKISSTKKLAGFYSKCDAFLSNGFIAILAAIPF
jgi:hypothetical protein